jgi:hypothetical protein
MTNPLCLIDSTNAINVELLDYIESTTPKISDEEVYNMKELLYSKYLRKLEKVQEIRDANRAAYNESSKLKMREHLKNNPIYREKQRLVFIKKRYGVETEAEVTRIKAEEAQAKAHLIFDRHNKKNEELKNLPPKISKRRVKMDFKTFVENTIVENQ